MILPAFLFTLYAAAPGPALSARAVHLARDDRAVSRPARASPETRFLTTSGPGLWIYHMQIANCDGLTYQIGRNGVKGRWKIVLADLAWTLEPMRRGGRTNVVLGCADGSACITSYAGTRTTGHLRSKPVPFAGPDIARSFVRRLDRLRETCARPRRK